MLVELSSGENVHVDVSKVVYAWSVGGSSYILKFGKDDTLRVTEESFKKVVEWLDWPDEPSMDQAVEAVLSDRAELCEQLRQVHGLSAFAKVFGFDMTSGEDWTWHDVAVALARRIENGPDERNVYRTIAGEEIVTVGSNHERRV